MTILKCLIKRRSAPPSIALGPKVIKMPARPIEHILLVTPYKAARVIGFLEEIVRPENTAVGERCDLRGKVVAMSQPDLDVVIMADGARGTLSCLSLAAVRTRRSQLVVRVPVAFASLSEPSFDFAVVQEAGVLLGARHRLWHGRGGWTIVPSRMDGRFLALSERGLWELSAPPWRDEKEWSSGYVEASKLFARHMNASSFVTH